MEKRRSNLIDIHKRHNGNPKECQQAIMPEEIVAKYLTEVDGWIMTIITMMIGGMTQVMGVIVRTVMVGTQGSVPIIEERKAERAHGDL